jgi:hypothetical protein
MNTILQNTNNYNDVITKLQHYILDETNIQHIVSMKNTNFKREFKTTKNLDNNSIQKSNNSIFVPTEKDTLFWCLYIMKNGETNYELLNNRNYIVEKKLKIDYIERIRNQKQLIKTYKFTTLSYLENRLANEDKIDVNTFLSLCVLENLNVIYINKKTYYQLSMSDSGPLHIIYSLDKYRFGHEINTNNTLIKSSLLQIDNIDKPIKSISNYKIQELIDICEKLSIETIDKDTNKKKNKNELYESLVQYF